MFRAVLFFFLLFFSLISQGEVRGIINRNPVLPPIVETKVVTVIRWLPPIIEIVDERKKDKKQDKKENKKTNSIEQPVITFDERPPAVLLTEAKTILTNRQGPYDQAINNLRSFILTQPVESAKEAHELLGYAYEKSKIFDKAKIEYSLYLKLYKDSNDDQQRVRQRLMALEIIEPTATADNFKERTPRQGDSFEFTGAVSEYFYYGSDSPSRKWWQWRSNSASAITGIQLDAKKRHDQYIWSSRLRFSSSQDLLGNDENYYRVSSAYVNFEDTFLRYNLRLGRQNSVAGAISRFDGISGWYRTEDQFKWTFSAGRPYTGPDQTASRYFVGADFEWKPYRDVTAGVYVNRSYADGFVERNALGLTTEYVTSDTNILFRTEYDTQYQTFNQLSLQGIKYFKRYNIFGSYERRRSPTLYGDVALGLGALDPEKQIYNSINELLNRSGLENAEIYKYITTTTPIATSLVLGANFSIDQKWSVTGDVQISNLSTTPSFDISPEFDPVPVHVGMKNNYSTSLHLTGENVIKENNTVEIVLNNTLGDKKSYFVTVADGYRFNDRNLVSVIVRYDNIDQISKILSANLRLIYNISDHGKIEAQYARSITIRPVTLLVYKLDRLSTNQSFYIGYRYEF